MNNFHMIILSGLLGCCVATRCMERPLQQPLDAPINEKTGSTLLHQAAGRGDYDEVMRLLEAGASVNVQTVAQWSPLHYAVFNDHEAIVRLLLHYGADVNLPRGDGFTPLHMAVSRQNKNMIHLLLEKGAQAELTGQSQTHDRSVLHVAASHPRSDILEMLVVHADSRRTSGLLKETPLHAAANCGLIDNVRLLLERNVSVDVQRADGSTALHLAATHGHADVVRLLLAHGAFVNTRNDHRATNESPLDSAVFNGHTQCLQPLLRYGADFSTNDVKVMDMIQKVFKDVPLLLNTIIGDQTKVKNIIDSLLLNTSLSLDECQELLYEALVFAVAQNRLVCIDLLLETLEKREWLSKQSLRLVLDHSVLVNRYDCTERVLKFMKERRLIDEDTALTISSALYNNAGARNSDLRVQIHSLLYPQGYHLITNAWRNMRSLYDRMSPQARWSVIAFAVGVGLLTRVKR